MTVVAAALIPGLPHLLASDPAPSWSRLADSARDVGARIRAADAECVVMMSTQWFTVLGHQFQLEPHCVGRHHDENWYRYDFGRLDYDFHIDAAFTQRWSSAVAATGLQSRNTRYDNFPIDTGTIVASELLGSSADLPLALVSCNLYADATAMREILRAGVGVAADRRVAVVAVSGLSSTPIQRWIDPGDDHLATEANEQWDRQMLDWLAAGDLATALARTPNYARAAQVDAQFRGLSFLAGSDVVDQPAEVLDYGPIWGTGGAVIYWPNTSDRTRPPTTDMKETP